MATLIYTPLDCSDGYSTLIDHSLLMPNGGSIFIIYVQAQQDSIVQFSAVQQNNTPATTTLITGMLYVNAGTGLALAQPNQVVGFVELDPGEDLVIQVISGAVSLLFSYETF